MCPALLIEKTSEGTQEVSEQSLSDAQLPEGDVTVRVEWSALTTRMPSPLPARGRL